MQDNNAAKKIVDKTIFYHFYAIYVNKNTVLTIDNSNNMIAKNKHYQMFKKKKITKINLKSDVQQKHAKQL